MHGIMDIATQRTSDMPIKRRFDVVWSKRLLADIEYYLTGTKDPVRRNMFAVDVLKVLVNLGYVDPPAMNMTRLIGMPSRIQLKDLSDEPAEEQPDDLSPETIGEKVVKLVKEEEDADFQQLRDLFKKEDC
jgi:hypothetical protein